jgi:3-oxoacyl-[acyl-carrier protein] reductase
MAQSLDGRLALASAARAASERRAPVFSPAPAPASSSPTPRARRRPPPRSRARCPAPAIWRCKADVADTASLLALREAARARCGEALHVLVNAAGFTRPVPHADLDGFDDALIDRMFTVNWRGQFAAIRTFAPMLKAAGNGLIVSVSSIAGQTGIGSSIAYCAVKAGIDVMTKSLAPEIRVMGVAPGVVDTGFVPGRGAEFSAKAAATTPLRRVATAEDVAAAVLACATSLSFSTGTTVVVDGGRSL